MFLTVDVGNTNILMGLYEGTALRHHWRLSTRTAQTDDEYAILIANLFHMSGLAWRDVADVILVSVVPAVQDTLVRMCRRYLHKDPLLVPQTVPVGIRIHYDSPRDVGADRLVNAIAAFDRLHTAALVIDLGTATTFDLVGPTGDFMGGVIAPGPGLVLEALSAKTAQLPRIDLVRPTQVIGSGTVSAMRSGAYWGYVGLVDGIIARMVQECGFAPLGIVATGGLARLVAGDSPWIQEVDEFLTLTGLRILYDRQQWAARL